MTRPVRLSSSLADDIDAQLDEPRTADFWTHDVVAAVALLSKPELWDSLPVHGGGRRLPVAGITVGAFHLFVARDELDARPDALVVYAIDIWPDGFPD